MKRGPGCCDSRLVFEPTLELASAAWNSDKFGIGSSPYLGDVASTALQIPAAPTEDQSHRYLFRLCVLSVPEGRVAVVRGLRTYVSIRAEIGEPEAGFFVPVELPVTSPMWSFVDGNVSWHLRTLNPNFYHQRSDPLQAPGTSPQVSGSDSAILYDPTLVPYIPPGAGVPPGEDVAYLGTWRDMRFPWNDTPPVAPLGVPVHGPSTLVLYASVHQTTPLNRPAIQTFGDPGALGPEDRFLLNYESDEAKRAGVSVRYGHIAGALLVELLPGEQV